MLPQEPQHAAIDAAVNGDNTLVAAVKGYRIRVVSLFVIAGGAVTTRYESTAGGTALTGQVTLASGVGYVLPYNPAGWFETNPGELLNLELSAGVTVDGCLTYVLIPAVWFS